MHSLSLSTKSSTRSGRGSGIDPNWSSIPRTCRRWLHCRASPATRAYCSPWAEVAASVAAVAAMAAMVEAVAVAEVMAVVTEVASTPAKSSARTNRSKHLEPALLAAASQTAARSSMDRAEAWLSALEVSRCESSLRSNWTSPGGDKISGY